MSESDNGPKQEGFFSAAKMAMLAYKDASGGSMSPSDRERFDAQIAQMGGKKVDEPIVDTQPTSENPVPLTVDEPAEDLGEFKNILAGATTNEHETIRSIQLVNDKTDTSWQNDPKYEEFKESGAISSEWIAVDPASNESKYKNQADLRAHFDEILEADPVVAESDPEVVNAEDEVDVTIPIDASFSEAERKTQSVLDDLKRVGEVMNSGDRDILVEKLRQQGVTLPETINEDSPIGAWERQKLREAVGYVDGTFEPNKRAGGSNIGWVSKDAASNYLRGLGVNRDGGDDTPPTPEPVPIPPEPIEVEDEPSITVQELIKAHEDHYQKRFLRNRGNETLILDDISDRIDSRNLLEVSGYPADKIAEWERRANGGDIDAIDEMFTEAQSVYLNSILPKGIFARMEALKRDIDALSRVKNLANGEKSSLVKLIGLNCDKLSLPEDQPFGRQWKQNQVDELIKFMLEKYSLAENEISAEAKFDEIREKALEKFDKKLQFGSQPKFDAPDLNLLYKEIDTLGYNITEDERSELESLAELMLVSRATLYMKHDPKVWSYTLGGSAPDGYMDTKWVGIVKKGMEDSVVIGILKAKETEKFQRSKVSLGLKSLYDMGKDNKHKGTSLIDITEGCADLKALGLSNYEARIAWMIFEQTFEPGFNDKSHLYGLTNTREAAGAIPSNIWWGSEWWFRSSVVEGVIGDNPLSEYPTNSVGKQDRKINSMPEYLWKSVGERLSYNRTPNNEIKFSDEVRAGRGMEFFEELFSTENLAMNEGVLPALQKSAVIAQSLHKKITDLGVKPETLKTSYLTSLKESLLDNMKDTDIRSKRDEILYPKKDSKKDIMTQDMVLNLLQSTSRILFASTSAYEPGIDDKTLKDPAAMAILYLELVSSSDGETNYFSYNNSDSPTESVSLNSGLVKSHTMKLRDFVVDISKGFIRNSTLMSVMEEKDKPRHNSILKLIQNRNDWPVPSSAIDFRELYKKLQEKFAYGDSLTKPFTNFLTTSRKNAETAMDAKLAKGNRLSRYLSGQ